MVKYAIIREVVSRQEDFILARNPPKKIGVFWARKILFLYMAYTELLEPVTDEGGGRECKVEILCFRGCNPIRAHND
jgi:hypothetical protein